MTSINPPDQPISPTSFPWVLNALCHLKLVSLKIKVKVFQSCLTLCDPMDYTVNGILHGRILEWVAFPFFRGSSQPRDLTQVSLIAGGFFISWATREAQWKLKPGLKEHLTSSLAIASSNLIQYGSRDLVGKVTWNSYSSVLLLLKPPDRSKLSMPSLLGT